MNTDGAVVIEQASAITQASDDILRRLDAYLCRLDLQEPRRSEIIDTVLELLRSQTDTPTMAEAIAALHEVLAQAPATPGAASVRASAAQRTEMWFDAAKHQASVDASFYLQRPLIKRMPMLPESRPEVAAGGMWRRMIRLYVGN